MRDVRTPAWSSLSRSYGLGLLLMPWGSNVVDIYSFVIPVFQEQFEMLEKVNQSRILVNTFDELEAEALRVVRDLSLIGIRPLIPSAFLDERDHFDKSFSGDLFKRSEDVHGVA
ncbi:UDP-glucuronosyl/UDP-glucosyltransferase [Parasponia andersonii]|uniref:UDP-glucuronosyl/UDP-glucosyltransferase n=1 Tax=Parasponia andersonii TaxID=3476 RepID=A0A2P5C3Q0_PARAD|nr:UDP-glucuronosyl/UDP-glucosyltransferase [Parasponia andersonii]